VTVDENILKKEVIRSWSKGGFNRPVKIVSSERGPIGEVEGYITQEKFVKGRTPSEIEKILGLKVGELRSGAFVMALMRLPKESEFSLRSYSNQPGGCPFLEGGQYPPGQGAPQWQLTTLIPATLIKFVIPDAVY
jgi:hypothetical protein